MDETINTKKDTGENLASGEHVLAEMPSFGEYRAEIESDVEDKEKINEEDRQKRNLGVEALDAVSTEQKLDPFWKKHPRLLEEARELGAPLTSANEFTKRGFSIINTNHFKEGNPDLHVFALTPKYRKYLESGGDPKKWFEGLSESERSNKPRYEDVYGRRRRIEAERIEHKKEIKRIEGGRVEHEKEIIESDWASVANVDAILGERFPDRDYMDYEKRRIRDEVPRLVYNHLERRRRDLSKPWRAKEIYSLAFRNSLQFADAEVSDRLLLQSANDRFSNDALCRVKNIRRNPDWWNPEPYLYASESPIVAELILQKRQMELLGDDVKESVAKLSSEELASCRQNEIKRCIADGIFLLDVITNNPGILKAKLKSLDKKWIITEAISSYKGTKNEEEKKKIADFFDLKGSILEMDEDPKSDLDAFVSHNKLYYIFGRDQHNNDNYVRVPRELSEAVIERHAKLVREITDKMQLQQNPDFLDAVEKDRAEYAHILEQKVYDNLMYRAKYAWTGDEFDYKTYLSVNKMPFDVFNMRSFRASEAERIIDSFYEDQGLLFWRHEVKGPIMDGIPDVAVDYSSVLTKALKDCLERGVLVGEDIDDDSRKSDIAYLTKVFGLKGFKENQERLGIDFKDPEIIELAFNGFLNTLATRNGEKSKQANWYYDNIFANDPGKFLGMVKAYQNDSENSELGIKGKLTRFFKNNPRAFEDKVRDDLEKRFQRDINVEKRVINASVLRNAKQGDIVNIVEGYKKRLVEKIREKGAEEIATFVGQKTTRGEQEETGKEDRKEVPFDFGLEKGNTLLKYGNFVENTFPDSNIQWFTDTFPKRGEDREIFDDQNSYIGFSFEYNGKLCVIAESLNEEAAMYLWRGEIGEDLNDDFRQMFDLSRFDAKRTEDPRIVSVGHLDKEHFDDSLDETYQKAFMFFNSGDKQEVLYKNYGGREKWNERRDEVLGAWPLSTEQDYVNYPEDLEGYHEWQQRQAEIQSRLKAAVEQGGQNAVKKELEKIAEEDYLAMYEGRR